MIINILLTHISIYLKKIPFSSIYREIILFYIIFVNLGQMFLGQMSVYRQNRRVFSGFKDVPGLLSRRIRRRHLFGFFVQRSCVLAYSALLCCLRVRLRLLFKVLSVCCLILGLNMYQESSTTGDLLNC